MIIAILYSDQIIPENAKIDARLADLLADRGRRIGYVPSGPEPTFRFFRERQAYYARLDLSLDLFFDLDANNVMRRAHELFACDAIHLSGGDTQAFLRRVVTSGLIEPLREWAKNGGVLIGTSAGAMLMTPTIALDALFSGARPEDVRDADALNLVPFEFFPHAKPEYLAAVTDYSATNGRTVAACPDGGGIVVSNGEIESLGNVTWLSNGVVIDAMKYVT